MKIDQDYIAHIIELAKEVEITDSIDWGYLNISEDQAYQLLANGLFDHVKDLQTDTVDILLAISLKLLVENFVLNLQLLQLKAQ